MCVQAGCRRHDDALSHMWCAPSHIDAPKFCFAEIKKVVMPFFSSCQHGCVSNGCALPASSPRRPFLDVPLSQPRRLRCSSEEDMGAWAAGLSFRRATRGTQGCGPAPFFLPPLSSRPSRPRQASQGLAQPPATSTHSARQDPSLPSTSTMSVSHRQRQPTPFSLTSSQLAQYWSSSIRFFSSNVVVSR